MISFFYESVDLELKEKEIALWITKVINSEIKNEGEINFIFCTDEYLLEMNQKFLNHDTYTDVISFDNTLGNLVGGDVFISYERVKDNATIFCTNIEEELRRVMAHGILHFLGYKDKKEKDQMVMRRKEEEKLAMFHVEHR